MNSQHAALSVVTALLIACTSASSGDAPDPSAAPLSDASTGTESPPVATIEDAAAPTAPGPSFVVQPEELVMNHPKAPGGQSKFITATLDPNAPDGDKPSMRLESVEGATSNGFGATTAVIEVDKKPVHGHRYRMRARIKTEDASSAWLWWRIDSPSSFTLDNMRAPVDRSVGGTHDWQELVLVLDVPEDATSFALGSGLSGKGRVWVGTITLEDVGTDVGTTPSFVGKL